MIFIIKWRSTPSFWAATKSDALRPDCVPVLKSHILPLIPGLDEGLKDGIRVLDVGCGRGWALNLLATWFPNSRFVGMDLSEEAIEFACAEAEERGNKNASFIAR